MWGIAPSELDAYFAEHRIPYVNLWQLINRSFRSGLKKISGREHKYSRLVLTIKGIYPKKGGSGAIPATMARRIEEKGGQVVCGAKAVGISVSGNRVLSVNFEKDGERKSMPCDWLISTIPVGEMISMISPRIPESLRRATGQLQYRSLRNVCLVVEKPPMFEAQSIYFMDKTFHRLSCINNFRGENMPAGRTGLMAGISCRFNDATWNAPQDELIQKVVAGLEEEGYITRRDVRDAFIISLRHAYPIYLVGYEERMERIVSHISLMENLLTGGRQGMFKYVDKDLAVRSGFEMADFVMKGKTKEELRGKPYGEKLFS